MDKKIILYSSTFLWVKLNRGLLYNTNNFNLQEFNVNGSIKAICDSLLAYENLYSVPINESNADIDQFIKLIESGCFGKIVDKDSENLISLPPLLNLQFSIERIEKDSGLDIGENALTYLHALTIYTGGLANNKDYHKQIIYPITSTEILEVNTIANYIERNNSHYIQTINIVISNIESYDIADLCSSLSNIKNKAVLYIYLPTNDDQIKLVLNILSNKFKIIFICDFESSKFILLSIKSYIQHFANIHFNLLVKNLDEYKTLVNLMKTYNIENYSVIPVYDNNIEFFNKNIFLTREDILASKLSKREIFAHQALNTLLFGHIIITPNGLVYSNINSKHIGRIDDVITDIIINELKENHAWRRIRDSKRCTKCLYQWLCPSPSNYEIVMRKECICSNEM